MNLIFSFYYYELNVVVETPATYQQRFVQVVINSDPN